MPVLKLAKDLFVKRAMLERGIVFADKVGAQPTQCQWLHFGGRIAVVVGVAAHKPESHPT